MSEKFVWFSECYFFEEKLLYMDALSLNGKFPASDLNGILLIWSWV